MLTKDLTRDGLLRLEGALQAAVEHGARVASRAQARLAPLTKADLRGRACHCPPGLPVHLVHSESLREACDVVVDWDANVRPRARPAVPVARLAAIAADIARGELVHVKSDLLPSFVEHVLPKVREPFVLVTGDSDQSVVHAHAALLADPRIAHWFAQSCDLPQAHGKLTRLPIGLDNPVYTKLDKRLGFLLSMALGKTPLDPSVSRNDIGDQRLLQHIARALPPNTARPARALCTFHQNQRFLRPDLDAIPERREAYDALRDEPACHFVEKRLVQHECFRVHGDFAFEVSPRGNGLDCFRTWEALALGTIPIVKTSALDRLYRDEDLPVVIVESYREVTAGNLRRWHAQLAGAFTAELTHRLTHDYWLEKLRRAATQAKDAA